MFITGYDLYVIGGGLAGSEASWQAAQRGLRVALYEMRPMQGTGAHIGADLAELVCSNSLGSDLPYLAAGLLKNELRRMGSLLISCAEKAAVPAGGSLAVDRAVFSRLVTEAIENHQNITIVREEVTEIPTQPTIIASGPLTSPGLSSAIQSLTGSDHLYFYDAIAPIVYGDSVDMTIAFRASRYGRGEQGDGDYINCPLNCEEYDAFISALIAADRIELHDYEKPIEGGVRAGGGKFFEGCLPIEVLARRGHDALAYGPMRPVGLQNPHAGIRHHAVLQLRQDNLAGTLYNLVGFQTNLTYPEQGRVFRMIPGLAKAKFARFGHMHRNTFVHSPGFLTSTLRCIERTDLFFAGQITGVEGYVGNIGTGLLAGINAARHIHGKAEVAMPTETMLGALCHYIANAKPRDFQPMKANFGILPPLDESLPKGRRSRRDRALSFVARAQVALDNFFK